VSVSGPEVGGFGLLNLTLLARRLGRRVDISGSLYNLLDKHYGDPAAQEHRQVAIPQDGRSFRVKLTLHF
jgi:iron complex outermembrane receptor protein